MDKTFVFEIYLIVFAAGAVITIGLVRMLSKGMLRFYEHLCQDAEIAKFFVKLSNVVLVLGGVGAALTASYNMTEDANWLTLTWNAASQLQEVMSRLFIVLTIFAVAFFIVQAMLRRNSK